jgi:prepilin signal peptidase PulO-like enzyme (type II secretory pathway)
MTDIPPPFDAAWFLALMGLVIGLALGSFITMLSYRLPHRMSIIKPGSHCPICKTPLTARDLVPVLSWVASGGKCCHCGTKISARYPLIELATGISCSIAFVLIGFQGWVVVAIVGVVIVITVVTILYEK